ncbi:non-specific protein-tyrosine kinase [Streptosporangium becharense]|uniref:non-specific protein-tyrosine kinase n=1 Tax=Streptosporangium becharense TaxID=1816182 RepID=A0A7W9IKV0_9ACTN|nr:polysaccharide biosynthesis tyrosine autokinase [Streptosporangium becharense]MBB2911640.1 non-specific protein-tyrosine kinase [Streptosporangium becharense]MBB5822542.1 non-specific protein-tyrosine kinase [Streptosporangium becharense]
MDLLYYVRLMRRNWPFLLLSLVLGVGTALTVTANTPPKYIATISMLVSGHDREGSLSTAYQAGMLSAQRVHSYANLLSSRRVVSQITHPGDVGRVQANITAEAVPGTVLLRATVTDPDPRRAADLANALGARFAELINQIERPTPASRPTVKVTVVDQASVPGAPISPRPVVNLLMGVLIALLSAMAAIVVRDRLDTTVKSSETLHHASGSSTLGIICYERDAKRHPLILRSRGRSSRAEAFRSLRTNLQFVGVDRKPRSLVVTSCLPGEGKSSTSANLAITLAQAGRRVILVDGDLRRPSIPGYLGIEGGTGLTDVLIDRARLEDVIQIWGDPEVAVLPSGQIPPNPSELLGSDGMRQVLDRLSSAYDMVIIDAPPLLPVTDAATLAVICDGALLVARHGKTRREHIAHAAQMLASINARVVGTVLNFAPSRGGRYYGYGYGYGYGYEAETEVKTPAGV